ncbi:CAAX amino terminal protease self- immunity [Lacunisphaera limnophila]|uniref:CAAX amino terminal protease self-immunity n=1 Tax=Lacunisphaera limnophila TaxID=1838286 RepID=A0A1D8AUR1_9BACT|nr:CPBP family intramembrane glutamic endopeptidase [Lacunisphaera limnophila]AOS44624.1 CAAX amino terminal protease self- immunity [Lacunisphaera limnophila]
MGQDNPLVLLVMLAGAGYLGKLWRDDLRAAGAGRPNPRAFPGAEPAGRPVMILAVVGTLLLLGLETGGELALGLTGQQSQMTVLFGLYTLAAAFLEEIIFRGYLVVMDRGRAYLLAGIGLASILFALLHPFLWAWRDGALHFDFTAKAWFSTGAIFVGSLWFYALRFLPLNPRASLAPCIAAHVTKNLGVFAIKYAQGFVSGWW